MTKTIAELINQYREQHYRNSKTCLDDLDATPTTPKITCLKCNDQGRYIIEAPGTPFHNTTTFCDCEKGLNQRKERAQKLLKHSAIPTRFYGYSVSSYLALPKLGPNQRIAAHQCMDYMRGGVLGTINGDRGGLFLTGNPGTGKSGLAAAVSLHAIREHGVTVIYRAVPDLLDYLKSTFNPDSDVSYDETFEKLREVDLLVLDDLGTEKVTDWVTEKLFQIIDYRYRHNARLIVTSNLSVAELVAHFGKHGDQTSLRIVDRILEMCAQIDVAGNNLR